MAFLVCLALIAGSFLTIQAGLNAQLRGGLGHPLTATLVSFLVGTVAVVLVMLAIRVPLPPGAAWGRASGWSWMGGVFGAGYVVATIVLAPRLGAGTLIGAAVAGQMLTAVLVDQFGWIGFAPHPISGARVLGALLIIGGVALVQR